MTRCGRPATLAHACTDAWGVCIFLNVLILQGRVVFHLGGDKWCHWSNCQVTNCFWGVLLVRFDRGQVHFAAALHNLLTGASLKYEIDDI